MNEEARLDAAIAHWARTDPLTTAGDEAAVARILGHAGAITRTEPWPARSATQRRSLWAGGAVAIAASVAMALLLAPGSRRAEQPATPGVAPVMRAATDGTDSRLFALLYTPTSEEEFLL